MSIVNGASTHYGTQQYKKTMTKFGKFHTSGTINNVN